MPQYIKQLIVVAVLAAVVFRLARPLCLNFITTEDYARRRNAWFALTLLEFLAPGPASFFVLEIPISIWFARRESNLAALYALLFWAVAPLTVRIPLPGGGLLFSTDYRLMLCIFVILPAAWQLWRERKTGDSGAFVGWWLAEFCIFAFYIMAPIHGLRYELAPGVLIPITILDVARRIALALISFCIPFVVISRIAARSKKTLLDAIATFCLASALLAVIAMFETAKSWDLYGLVSTTLSNVDVANTYLLRNGVLRAAASTNGALLLGLILVVAIGLFLGLQSYLKSRAWKSAAFLVLLGGLVATHSRGPWLGLVAMYCLFLLLRPHGMGRLLKLAMIAGLVAVPVLLSPLGASLLHLLPFHGATSVTGGKLDFNTEYRLRLWSRTVEVFLQNPILGDPNALLQMQDLRQGDGIIDVLSAYSVILLGQGSVGLVMFAGFTLVIALATWYWSRRWAPSDPGFAEVGAAFTACVVSVLVMIASNGLNDAELCLVLALAAAYRNFSRYTLRDARSVSMASAGVRTVGDRVSGVRQRHVQPQ